MVNPQEARVRAQEARRGEIEHYMRTARDRIDRSLSNGKWSIDKDDIWDLGLGVMDQLLDEYRAHGWKITMHNSTQTGTSYTFEDAHGTDSVGRGSGTHKGARHPIALGSGSIQSRNYARRAVECWNKVAQVLLSYFR